MSRRRKPPAMEVAISCPEDNRGISLGAFSGIHLDLDGVRVEPGHRPIAVLQRADGSWHLDPALARRHECPAGPWTRILLTSPSGRSLLEIRPLQPPR